MDAAAAEFQRIVVAMVRRFHRQNAAEPPAATELAGMAERLAGLVRARGGLHPAVRPGESEMAALAAEVAGTTAGSLGLEAARQLVKACWYPPLVDCRDTFREVTREGECRRQQLERVRGRISGTHCVDCPHWTALEPGRHAEYLAAEWRTDPAAFAAHRDVFLPEDFRALRRWLQTATP
jgi:hypothetical protein